jgi:hypothetical protein
VTDSGDVDGSSRSHGIRKNPPSSPSPESTIVTKRPRQFSTGSRQRVRGRDFDELTQKVLDAAIKEYRVIVCTKDAFPEADVNRKLSALVWVNACAALKVQIQPNEDLMRLVSAKYLSAVFSLLAPSDNQPRV